MASMILAASWGHVMAEGSEGGGQVTGWVVDRASDTPIEYATVAVFSAEDSSLVTGTISDTQGRFETSRLDEGSYYVVVKFIGYEEKWLENLTVDRGRKVLEVGEIDLELDMQVLEEVEIINERNSVEYRIDKKVVSVGEQMTAASLSAVEVLENVPSIRVDIEGNVSLRGSTGFTVLIDGKPTVLEPSEVLRQTPASTIDNIEIITNPSAKYQPDGTGGIINIITKKNRTMGIQGLVNANVGRFGSYGGDFLLNYRRENLNLFVGGDYRQGPYPWETRNERRTTQNDTTTVIESGGDSEFKRSGGGIRTGLDWDITPRDNFTAGVRIGGYSMQRNSYLDYLTYTDPATIRLEEFSNNKWQRASEFINFDATYLRKFSEEDHELLVQFSQSFSDADEFSMNFLEDADGLVKEGTRNTEAGPGRRTELKIDYARPLLGGNMLEAGLQYRKRNSYDITQAFLYDTVSGDFILQPDQNYSTNYYRDTWSIYGLFQGERNNFGYQAGLRTEYTYRDISAPEDPNEYSIDRWDLFPTLHLSYKLPKDHQLMASYSRRIDRPGGRQLEPFLQWTDMFNVRRGNPSLEPEFIDALELGYIYSRDRSQFSLELYYRAKQNKIERIQEVYQEGVLLHTFENVGNDYSFGTEAMYNVTLFPWWEVNLMADLYNYRIKSERNGTGYEYQSFNWGTRLNNTFNIAKKVRIQFDGNYNSPTVTTQGEEKGYYEFNAAVRTDLLDRKLSLVLQARDVFATGERVSITRDIGFYNYQYRSNRAPILSLTVTYRLNNYRESRNAGGQGGGGDDF